MLHSFIAQCPVSSNVSPLMNGAITQMRELSVNAKSVTAKLKELELLIIEHYKAREINHFGSFVQGE